VAWATNNGWKDGARSIVTGEASLAHSRAVVDNEGSNFIFHGSGLLSGMKLNY
jgi:hypothetical protein